MRAVVTSPGVPGYLTIEDVDEPVPGPGEALVRVKAVSLNLGEIRHAQGMEEGQRIGWDLAGIVEQPAADGSGPPRGARVVGFIRTGAWAELAVVPTNALAELPEEVTFAQAATLPVAGLTALHAIERGSGLIARRVLVTGASGGVGHFCCQLAMLSGAKVVGQIRHERYRDLVIRAGADHVVVNDDGSAASEFAPYKLISDGVGGKVLANIMGMLAPDGVCVAYGSSAGSEITFDLWSLAGIGRASLYGLYMSSELVREPASEGLARLVSLVSGGRIKPEISAEEPWDKVGEVVRDFLGRIYPGKVVLHIT